MLDWPWTADSRGGWVTAYELELRDTENPDVVLVEAVGELDLTNAAEIEQRLVELSSDAKALVLDLNRVSFIDSAALHVLFRIGRLRGAGDFGIVLEPTAPIARTLGIVGLGDFVKVRASLVGLVAELGT
jgi:anti-anti-sigma factor